MRWLDGAGRRPVCVEQNCPVMKEMLEREQEDVMQQAWKPIVALTVTAVLSLGLAAVGAADFSNAPRDEQGAQLGVPQTADEHLARAAYYKEKAAAYRREAETHHKMFADYDKKHGSPGAKALTAHDASITKMRKHCDEYIKEAETLAAETERFAEFHRMLGEQMKGK